MRRLNLRNCLLSWMNWGKTQWIDELKSKALIDALIELGVLGVFYLYHTHGVHWSLHVLERCWSQSSNYGFLAFCLLSVGTKQGPTLPFLTSWLTEKLRVASAFWDLLIELISNYYCKLGKIMLTNVTFNHEQIT